MTAAERERLGSLSSRLTHALSIQRDEIRSLKHALDDLEYENDQLRDEISVLKDSENDYCLRIIELKGNLSAKDIEIRRLETEILRLNMKIDEKS